MSPIDLLEAPEVETSTEETSDCLCGVPNCKGHEMVDGEIHIPDHPLGYLILHNRPAATDA